MEKKIEIEICLGSSCFARGNKQTIRVIKQYLQDHHLDEKVYFHGSHCFGNCSQGPVLKINNQYFEEVDQEKVQEILEQLFE